MDWTARLSAAIDYMETHLEGELDMVEAANKANCSVYHFARMFDVVCGISPVDYVRRRRLSLAAIELSAGKQKVLDLALRYGYESPEAFTKAFRRQFGCSPRDVRTGPCELTSWPPLRLAVILKGDKEMQYRIVEKEAFKVRGYELRTTSDNGENMKAIPQFWDNAHKTGKVRELEVYAGKLGMLGLCHAYNPNDATFAYVIGIEDCAAANVLTKTSVVTIPAATYVVFPSIGAMPDAIQQTWQRAYNEWFPSSGYEHAGTPDFEVYPAFDDERGNPDSSACYTEVWIPIRKKPV